MIANADMSREQLNSCLAFWVQKYADTSPKPRYSYTRSEAHRYAEEQVSYISDLLKANIESSDIAILNSFGLVVVDTADRVLAIHFIDSNNEDKIAYCTSPLSLEGIANSLLASELLAIRRITLHVDNTYKVVYDAD